MKKLESQIDKLDKLKLKVIVLHDSIGKEVHMTQVVEFIAVDSILLVELGGVRLDKLRMAWSPGQGVRRQLYWCSPMKSTWYYIVFDSNLRKLHRGGELWGESVKSC